MNEAARLINEAERPFMLVGQGVELGEAHEELKAFVEKSGIPVARTLMGLSAFPTDHPLCVGMLGMHGNYGPNVNTNNCDLLIAVGMRFSDRVTGKLSTYAKQAKVIHIDIDHAEINRVIFDAKSIEEIKAQKLTYEKMELYSGGELCIIVFTNEMKISNGICDADIVDIVNSVRSIDGVLVALALKQNSKDETKYSLSSRANAEIDVSRVCQSLGGGGHIRAAGATIIASSPDEAKNQVIPLFENAINEFKKGNKNG
jgi:hypothetical protein